MHCLSGESVPVHIGDVFVVKLVDYHLRMRHGSVVSGTLSLAN